MEVEPIEDSMKMDIAENDYVEVFLDIKDNNEKILESEQIYDENDGKREELSRRFEKKDANFGIDFDTNQLIFAHDFFVILSMQVMKKLDWRGHKFVLNWLIFSSKRIEIPKVKMKRSFETPFPRGLGKISKLGSMVQGHLLKHGKTTQMYKNRF